MVTANCRRGDSPADTVLQVHWCEGIRLHLHHIGRGTLGPNRVRPPGRPLQAVQDIYDPGTADMLPLGDGRACDVRVSTHVRGGARKCQLALPRCSHPVR